MANTEKYLGGSNQIAHLPYKTIDALQQMGISIEKGVKRADYYTQHYFLNSEITGANQFVNNLPGGLPIIITSSGSLELRKQDINDISKLRKGNRNMFIWKSYSDLDFCICTNLAWKDNKHTNITFDALRFTFSNTVDIEYVKYDSSKDEYGDVIYTVPQAKYRHNTKITKNGDVLFMSRETTDADPYTVAFQVLSGWGSGYISCTGYNAEKGKTIVAFTESGPMQYTPIYSDGTTATPISAMQLTSADFTDNVSQ